jgi:hypothetical protein
MDDDSRQEQLLTILSSYSEDELHGILTFMKTYVAKHSSTAKSFRQDMNIFRKMLEDNNVPVRCIERECIWRMKLLGLITKEEAHEQIDAIDRACRS